MFKFTKNDIIKSFKIINRDTKKKVDFDTFRSLCCSEEFQYEFKNNKDSNKFIIEAARYARKGSNSFYDFLEWCIIYEFEFGTDKKTGNIVVNIEAEEDNFQLVLDVGINPDLTNGL